MQNSPRKVSFSTQRDDVRPAFKIQSASKDVNSYSFSVSVVSTKRGVAYGVALDPSETKPSPLHIMQGKKGDGSLVSRHFNASKQLEQCDSGF